MRAPVLSPGSLILSGRYRVTRPLGEGGMGAVYLGEQVSLGRRVAIKALHPELKDHAAMAERFDREARLLSAIEHPSVVRVIEFGEDGGASYLVMEFAEGETLHAVLQRGPLAPQRAQVLLQQLAEGLAAIHQAGIVHRDLKPENVMLSPGPRGELARLLDFGIARFVHAGESAVSQVGTVLGTPEYLSPEQATGAPVDARSDLYSLGVVAYRALAGVLPFNGPSARDFLVQHVKQPPAPLERVNPALAAHPTLCASVMRLLEKEPARRFDSAMLFVDALAAAGEAQGSRSTPVPPAPVGTRTSAFSPVPPSAGTAAFPALAAAEASAAPFAEAARSATAPGQTSLPARPPEAERHRESAPSPLRRMPWRAAALAVAAVMVTLVLAYAALGSSTETQALALLEKGQLDAALALVESVPPPERSPRLHSAHAVALHRKGRHKNEQGALRALDAAALARLEPEVLSALAEDFGRNESDAALLKLLAAFPDAARTAHLKGLAQGAPSAAQWGALRYLDESKRAEALDLPMAYATSLTMEECAVRALAARRLTALADERTRDALTVVARSKSGSGVFNRGSCGQREASAALKALERAER